MRQIVIVIATLLLAACLYVANFGIWVQSDLGSREAFVERALESFEQEGSYEALGVIVADRMTAEYPAIALLGDSLSSLLGSLLATEPFTPALAQVASDIHDRLVNGTDAAVVIDLADYEDIIVASVSIVAPGLVDLIPEDLFRDYVVFNASEVPDLSEEFTRLKSATWAAALVGALTVGAIVMTSSSVAQALAALGAASLLAGSVTALIGPIARDATFLFSPNEAYRVVVLNLYDTVTVSLTTSVWVLTMVGLGLLAVAAVLGLVARAKRTSEST